MVRDEILDSLMELGFSTNEARAYKGLLADSPATGYEIAQRAGIPRSAIYTVLKRLEDEGVVARVEESPTRYAPLPPADLLGVLRHRFNRSLDELTASLRRVRPPLPTSDLWNVRGDEEIGERARGLIDCAERQVAGSAWPSDLERLTPTLVAAKERGVRLVLFSPWRVPTLPFLVHGYDIAEPEERHERHPLVLVVDRSRVLVVGRSPRRTAQAVVTSHPALVDTTLTNLALELSLWGQRQGREVGSVVAELLDGHLGTLDPALAPRRL